MPAVQPTKQKEPGTRMAKDLVFGMCFVIGREKPLLTVQETHHVKAITKLR